MDFATAERKFRTARDPYAGKPLANNTRLMKVNDDTYAVKLHGTHVVTLHRDGRVVLRTGGWHSMTTKDRLNGYSPDGVYVSQVRREWFVQTRDGLYVWQEGFTVDAGGYCIMPGAAPLSPA